MAICCKQLTKSKETTVIATFYGSLQYNALRYSFKMEYKALRDIKDQQFVANSDATSEGGECDFMYRYRYKYIFQFYINVDFCRLSFFVAMVSCEF